MGKENYNTVSEFIQKYPDNINYLLKKELLNPNHSESAIDRDVRIDDEVRIGHVRKIGKNSIIGFATAIEDDVVLGDHVEVGPNSVIRKGTYLSDDFSIPYGRAFFDHNSGVEPSIHLTRHTFLRTVHENISVGAGVILPSEVQLGEGAVIPVQNSIQQIGRFGDSQRMVTAYGSPEGPLYSVGCQYGISINTFRMRAKTNTETSAASAGDYLNNMSYIEEAGQFAQKAYEQNSNAVSDLLAHRSNYGI